MMPTRLTFEYFVDFIIIFSTFLIYYNYRYIKRRNAANYYFQLTGSILCLALITGFCLNDIFKFWKNVFTYPQEVCIRIMLCGLAVAHSYSIINEAFEHYKRKGPIIFEKKYGTSKYLISAEWVILEQLQLFGFVFLVSEILVPSIFDMSVFWDTKYSFLIPLVITVSATFIPLGLALVSLFGNRLENNRYGIPYMEYFLLNKERRVANIDLMIATFLSVPIQLIAAGLSLYNYVIASAVVGLITVSALVIGCFNKISSVDQKDSYKQYLLYSLRELFERAHYLVESKKGNGQDELEYCVRQINRYVMSCQKYTAKSIKEEVDDYVYTDDCCILQSDILEMVNLSYCNNPAYKKIVENYMEGMDTIIDACISMNKHSEAGAVLRYQEMMFSLRAPSNGMQLKTYYELASEDHFTDKIIYGLCDFLRASKERPTYLYLIYLIQTVSKRLIFYLYIGILAKNNKMITEKQLRVYRWNTTASFLYPLHYFQIVYKSEIDDLDENRKILIYGEICEIHKCLQEGVYKWIGLDDNFKEFWVFDRKLKNSEAIEECKAMVDLFITVVIEELDKIVNGWSLSLEKQRKVDFQPLDMDLVRRRLSLDW